MKSLAAVDIGATSGRVMLGRVSSDVLELTEAHRFPNGAVRLPDGLYWDALGLFSSVLTGLRKILRQEQVAGLAVDSWAVDYGLVDAAGRLVGNPYAYRDSRTEPVIPRVHEKVPAAELYAANGLQHLPFNTLYQFAAEPTLDGYTALLIPDLIGYWLTDVMVAEQTNASTTGLLDATTGELRHDLVYRLGFPDNLMPPVVAAGSVVGPLSKAVGGEIGAVADLLVTTVGSHDTASAVVGVPAENLNFGYVSLGTWGLVGVELDRPVLSEASRAANFTNERGVDGTVRYLRNVMGLWLLSESVRHWNVHGKPKRAPIDLDAALAAAAALPPSRTLFDPNDPVFMAPGDMPARIAEAVRERGGQPPRTVPEVLRCILDSLADALAVGIREAADLSGRRIDIVHIVGGGSRNELLCRLLADTLGVPVMAGPVEATALGNLVVQARTHGELHGDLWDLRARIRAVVNLRTYQPGTCEAR